MRWQAPSERTQMWILGPIVFPAAAFAAVMLSPLILLFWIDHQWRRRQILRGRHVWFAWRPVKFDSFWYDDVPSCWYWLERIERRLNGNGWQYWPLGFDDPYEPAQGTDARSGETACGLAPKGDGPVGEADASKGNPA